MCIFVYVRVNVLPMALRLLSNRKCDSLVHLHLSTGKGMISIAIEVASTLYFTYQYQSYWRYEFMCWLVVE